MPKTISLKSLFALNAKLTKEAKEEQDFDVGVNNGSGEFVVRAAEAKEDKAGVAFNGVEIEVTPPKGWNGEGHPYCKWNSDSLSSYATDMLRKEYCK